MFTDWRSDLQETDYDVIFSRNRRFKTENVVVEVPTVQRTLSDAARVCSTKFSNVAVVFVDLSLEEALATAGIQDLDDQDFVGLPCRPGSKVTLFETLQLLYTICGIKL